jgi:hypothetical protein
MKIIVFDLDETMGYFTELGIFWDCLNRYLSNKNMAPLNQTDFNNVLQLYPEFIRPNIVNILQYLKVKKEQNCCHKIMIYTNNQGPKVWATYIKGYFENEINYALFDKIIAAFKVNGKTVEICRSSHAKNHKDFIKCTQLPKNAEICFLDDSFYPGMANNNIYYINVKPYYHDLKFKDMIDLFVNSKMSNSLTDKTDFCNSMLTDFARYNYEYIHKSNAECEIDKILGKKIMMHLEYFFNSTNNKKTMKKMKTMINRNSNKPNKNKTRKIH